jgi:hypothetical protein
LICRGIISCEPFARRPESPSATPLATQIRAPGCAPGWDALGTSGTSCDEIAG